MTSARRFLPISVNGHAGDTLDAEAGRVFDAYLADLETGRPADPEGLVAAHPHLADRLRACLVVLGWTDRLVQGRAAEPGLMMGDFRIVREIGRGGMGVVYEAEQLSLGRRVALKVLQASAAIDPKQFQRFQVEVRAAACLHHSHVVPVFTTGNEQGVYYYAMQYIEGHGLDAVIRNLRRLEGLEETEPEEYIGESSPCPKFPRGRGFFETGARLAIQAADALDHVHSLGIVHRDIKPANVLIDTRGDLWVTDFGLARVLSDSNLTATGDVIGTARYMSPEQMLGERAVVDDRSDIYSLGATLYELLTLRPAYDGRDRAGLVYRIGTEEPKPPRLLNPAIPRDLETVVLKAMAHDPSDRYTSARDLADDLRRFLDHRPVRARRSGLWRRACKWARRHLAAVISAALALAISGLAIGVVATRVGLNHQLELAGRQADYARDIARAFYLVERSELTEAMRVLEQHAPGVDAGDFRSFPWYYLRRVSRYRPMTLPGHSDSDKREVYHIEYSPRGDVLASCGQDGSVRLWDPESGRLLRLLRANNDDVNWVTFSPDGLKLATGSDDGSVRLWDLSGEGEPRPITLGRHDDWVTCVQFTPDGSRLLSSSRDGRITLWDVMTRRVHRTIGAQPGAPISPDGRTFATGSGNVIKLSDVDTFQEKLAITGHEGLVMCSAFSNDGRRLVSGSAEPDKAVKLWNVSGGPALATGRGHQERLNSVVFSPDDRLVASCGDRSIRIWDGQTLMPLQVYRAVPYRQWSVAFSRDGRTLASCGDDGLIRLWDVGFALERTVFRLPVTRVNSLALPPGTDNLIVAGPPEAGSRDRVTVSSWNLRQGARLVDRQFSAPRVVVSSTLSEDGKTLAIEDAGRVLELRDLDTGVSGETLRLPDIGGFAVSGFKRPLLLLTWVKGHSMEPLLWDLGSGKAPLRFRGGTQDPSIVPRIDGNCVVIAGSRSLFRWDFAGDKVTRVEQPHDTAGSWMCDLTISRDGRHLATGRDDHSIQLWKARTLEWEATLLGHRTTIICLDFSPDGRVLASASEDGIIKLWDVATRLELMTLQAVAGDADGQHHLRFSPDGSALVYCFSARKKGFAIVWLAPRDSEFYRQ